MGTLLLPAYEAWLNGDPQTTLVEIDGVLQTFERLGISNRRVPALGILYSALGKRQLAQQWFTNNLDRMPRLWNLVIFAYREGDDEAMKDYLIQYLTSENNTGDSRSSLRGLSAHPQNVIL
jgi:hypothetical protein